MDPKGLDVQMDAKRIFDAAEMLGLIAARASALDSRGGAVLAYRLRVHQAELGHIAYCMFCGGDPNEVIKLIADASA